VSEKWFSATSFRAISAVLLASTAKTLVAPACAQNMDRIPVPAPTSNTVFPSNTERLDRIAFLYAFVLAVSCIINLWTWNVNNIHLESENTLKSARASVEILNYLQIPIAGKVVVRVHISQFSHYGISLFKLWKSARVILTFITCKIW